VVAVAQIGMFSRILRFSQFCASLFPSGLAEALTPMEVNAYDGAQFCAGIQDCINSAALRIRNEFQQAVNSGLTLQEKAANLRAVSQKYSQNVSVRITVNGANVSAMETVADYLQQKIAENLDGDIRATIRALRFDALVDLLKGQVGGAAVKAFRADLLFKDEVAARRPWDYKAHIVKAYRAWSFDRETGVLYNYDIWGNIHYGILGAAALFSAFELYAGAAGAQVWDNGIDWVLKHGFVDDERDEEAVSLGIELWKLLKRSPSTEEIVDAVRARAMQLNTL
jgi:hypothetical protein